VVAMRNTTLWVAGLLMLQACTDCGGLRVIDTRANPSISPSPTLDFGQVDVTQRKTVSFTIKNGGDRKFDEITYALSADTDPAFTLGTNLPTQVSASGSKPVEVRCLPLVATTLAGKLTIRGRVAEEGAADPKFAEFVLDLRAVAVNNGLPRMEVTPLMVDFGRVGLNDVARATITIKNVGIRDLIVTEARLDGPTDSPFRCATCASINTVLTPTSAITTEVAFSPAGLETYAATLHILSLDPNNLDVAVSLQGAGSVVPTACISFLDDVSMLRPETTVRLDGACSEATVPGTWIQHYEWELTYRTPGSQAVLLNVLPMNDGARGLSLDIECPDPAATGATPCSTRMDTVADLAGTYEATLVVVDNMGIRSAPTTARYRAIPEQALHIQLVWDHPTADLDLHFMKNQGPPFNRATDCYFGNRFPAWWGDTNDSDPRNPRLDVDDTGGFGPENINVREPEPGCYRIGVHYWNKKTDGDPSVLATVRVYVRGQLALEQGQFFATDQQFWNVVDLCWPADPMTPASLDPVNDVVPYPRPF
jgi:hypothetical protein